jgi:hypothetical protein
VGTLWGRCGNALVMMWALSDLKPNYPLFNTLWAPGDTVRHCGDAVERCGDAVETLWGRCGDAVGTLWERSGDDVSFVRFKS